MISFFFAVIGLIIILSVIYTVFFKDDSKSTIPLFIEKKICGKMERH